MGRAREERGRRSKAVRRRRIHSTDDRGTFGCLSRRAHERPVREHALVVHVGEFARSTGKAGLRQVAVRDTCFEKGLDVVLEQPTGDVAGGGAPLIGCGGVTHRRVSSGVEVPTTPRRSVEVHGLQERNESLVREQTDVPARPGADHLETLMTRLEHTACDRRHLTGAGDDDDQERLERRQLHDRFVGRATGRERDLEDLGHRIAVAECFCCDLGPCDPVTAVVAGEGDDCPRNLGNRSERLAVTHERACGEGHGVHALEAVRRAGLQDQTLVLVLEGPPRPPRCGSRNGVVLGEQRKGCLRLGRSEDLSERDHVVADLLIPGNRLIRKVVRIDRVLSGDRHIEAVESAGRVHRSPEVLLRLCERHGNSCERTVGEVRDHAEVDATVIRVLGPRAWLRGHADIEIDARRCSRRRRRCRRRGGGLCRCRGGLRHRRGIVITACRRDECKDGHQRRDDEPSPLLHSPVSSLLSDELRRTRTARSLPRIYRQT